jgi:hypothetical protein
MNTSSDEKPIIQTKDIKKTQLENTNEPKYVRSYKMNEFSKNLSQASDAF